MPVMCKMAIHVFNGFTCNARRPSKLKTGLVCTPVETDQGLDLIDTGPGLDEYAHPHAMLRLFQAITRVHMNPQETAIRHADRLGFRKEDVCHVILTHMQYDHRGGLPGFPNAKVPAHRQENEALTGRLHRRTDLAYIRRHIAHRPEFFLYRQTGEQWYDFDAIHMPFGPEIWLVPLFGYTWGHCGVAVKLSDSWSFNAADAGAVYNDEPPAWVIRLVLGPHDPRLRAFMPVRPEVRLANSPMTPEWYTVARYA
jgi:glyoxylase-like metal-dependent hydrolase (beta-lactamase superfamily II)